MTDSDWAFYEDHGNLLDMLNLRCRNSIDNTSVRLCAACLSRTPGAVAIDTENNPDAALDNVASAFADKQFLAGRRKADLFVCAACQLKVSRHLANRKLTFPRAKRAGSPFANTFKKLVALLQSLHEFMPIPAQVLRLIAGYMPSPHTLFCGRQFVLRLNDNNAAERAVLQLHADGTYHFIRLEAKHPARPSALLVERGVWQPNGQFILDRERQGGTGAAAGAGKGGKAKAESKRPQSDGSGDGSGGGSGGSTGDFAAFRGHIDFVREEYAYQRLRLRAPPGGRLTGERQALAERAAAASPRELPEKDLLPLLPAALRRERRPYAAVYAPSQLRHPPLSFDARLREWGCYAEPTALTWNLLRGLCQWEDAEQKRFVAVALGGRGGGGGAAAAAAAPSRDADQLADDVARQRAEYQARFQAALDRRQQVAATSAVDAKAESKSSSGPGLELGLGLGLDAGLSLDAGDHKAAASGAAKLTARSDSDSGSGSGGKAGQGDGKDGKDGADGRRAPAGSMWPFDLVLDLSDRLQWRAADRPGDGDRVPEFCPRLPAEYSTTGVASFASKAGAKQQQRQGRPPAKRPAATAGELKWWKGKPAASVQKRKPDQSADHEHSGEGDGDDAHGRGLQFVHIQDARFDRELRESDSECLDHTLAEVLEAVGPTTRVADRVPVHNIEVSRTRWYQEMVLRGQFPPLDNDRIFNNFDAWQTVFARLLPL